MPLTVEIWSDVVCPWCYVGKRRFEAALERFPHRAEVSVLWRSFELDPGAPIMPEGTAAERLAQKYGITVERALEMHAQMTELAAGEGLDYHLDRARGGNTFAAHRLIHEAAAHGHQAAAQERLMRAYFTEGEPISDPETLARLVAEVGVDPEEARAAAFSDRHGDAVREDELLASRLGIQGVPFFVLDRQEIAWGPARPAENVSERPRVRHPLGVSGAQPPDVLLAALERAWGDLPAAAA